MISRNNLCIISGVKYSWKSENHPNRFSVRPSYLCSLVLGMQCILNIEQVVAILCDYRLTRDWMYAFRWVPPRHFRSRLKAKPFTSREESVYLAHKGHLISECLLGVIDIPKKPTKNLTNICPESKKWSNQQSISTLL